MWSAYVSLIEKALRDIQTMTSLLLGRGISQAGQSFFSSRLNPPFTFARHKSYGFEPGDLSFRTYSSDTRDGSLSRWQPVCRRAPDCSQTSFHDLRSLPQKAADLVENE